MGLAMTRHVDIPMGKEELLSRGEFAFTRGVFCLLRFTSAYGVNNVYRENY